MSAFGKSILLTSLVVCAASPAAALDLNQPSLPAGDAPAITLPAFLDVSRLPDLQEAWRAHVAQPQASPAVAPAVEPASTSAPQTEAPVLQPVSTAPMESNPPAVDDKGPSPDPASDAVIQSARATLVRAEQATRDADAVRLRAEELSSRFGAGESTAAPATGEATIETGGTITTGPTPTASEPTTAATDPAAAPAIQETAPESTAAIEPAQPAAEAVAAPEKKTETAATDGGPTADLARKKPTTLMRAGVMTASPTRTPAAAARKPPEPARTETESDPTKPDDPDAFWPAGPRAFGWNTQPN